MSDEQKKFATGAVRSMDAEETRYDLITPIGLAEVARRYAEGAVKYGEHNWLKGMPVNDLLNHALRHIYLFMSGDRSDAHLAGAAWGLLAAIHSDKMWPHLNGNLLGPGCTPPSPGGQEPAAAAPAEPEVYPEPTPPPRFDGCVPTYENGFWVWRKPIPEASNTRLNGGSQ